MILNLMTLYQEKKVTLLVSWCKVGHTLTERNVAAKTDDKIHFHRSNMYHKILKNGNLQEYQEA
jgi:hypothetical protein